MKSFATFLLLSLIICKLSAQDVAFEYIDTVIAQSFETKLTGVVINPGAKFSEKCVTKDWLVSDIILNDNEIVTNKQLKYNGFDDSFVLWEASNFRVIRLEREFIKEVKMKNSFDNSYLIFKPIKMKLINSGNETTFLQVLVEGKNSVYVYKHIEYFKVGDSPQPNYQFILKKQDGTISQFKPNKKSLLAQFRENKKELKNILNKNDLNVKKEKGLAKAIEIFNSTLTN